MSYLLSHHWDCPDSERAVPFFLSPGSVRGFQNDLWKNVMEQLLFEFTSQTDGGENSVKMKAVRVVENREKVLYLDLFI